MATGSDILISVPTSKGKKEEATPEMKALEAKYGERLLALDTDGDGQIDRSEILRFIDQVVHKETQIKQMKIALGALLGLLVLFALTTFGVTWGVVVLSRQVNAQTTTVSTTNPSLTDNSGATLRTASASITRTPIAKNSTSDSFANVTLSENGRRRLLQAGGSMDYASPIAIDDVIAGCKLVIEGDKTFTSVEAGVDDTAVLDVTVQVVSGNSCQTAVVSGNVANLQANILIEGDLAMVVCDSGSNCQVFQKSTPAVMPDGSAAPAELTDPIPNRRLQSIMKDAFILELNGGRQLVCHKEHGKCDLVEAPAFDLLQMHERSLKGLCGNLVCWPPKVCKDKCCAQCIQKGGGVAGAVMKCFPAKSMIITERNGPQHISTLMIGDKVLASHSDGNLFFDDVYMFGHKNMDVKAQFVKLQTSGKASLRLTSDHLVPIVRDGHRLVIHSKDVQVGDLVQVHSANATSATFESIITKSIVSDVGLFNPYTLSGTIVVDGVVASCHSSWVFDTLFELLNVNRASGYQTLFAPIRFIYKVVGPKRFASVEFVIDAVAVATVEGRLSNASVTAPATVALGLAGIAALLTPRKRLMV
jgi:desert hedgehog protein